MPNPNSHPTAPRIAIIGGGISGLTAAYRLSTLMPAADLQLFEASDRLGGVLCTRRDDEYLLECGADSFIDKLPAAVELCRELGLGDQILPTNTEHRRALVLCDGRLQPVPPGFVQMQPELLLPLLRSPILSWAGKQRMLAEWNVPPHEQINDDNFDESVAAFATRRLGREVFERLVQPLLAGIYTADPYQLSVAATMPTAIAAEREHGSLRQAALAKRETSQASGARYASFVTLRGGLETLVEALASKLGTGNVHLNAQVQGVAPTDDGHWSVVPVSGDAEMFDGVVIGLPAPRASELLTDASSQLSDELAQIPYASSAVAVLAYRREQIRDPLEGFGIVVPTVEGRKLVAASFLSIKFPGRAPSDEVVIRAFMGGALQPELMDLTDEQLVALAQSELDDIVGIQGNPQRTELVRWQEKMPQYHVGHLQTVEQIERLTADIPGLELAGNAYRGVGIPQCVASGERAARQLAQVLPF